MKTRDLRASSSEELGKVILGYKKELFNLRFQQASGELKNTSRYSQLKRAIARTKTISAEKQNSLQVKS